jgi:hypothetical protein
MGFFRRLELTYEDGPIHPGLKNFSGEYKFSMNIVGNVSVIFGEQPLHIAAVDRCNKTCLPGKFAPVNPPPFSQTIVSLFGNSSARSAHLAGTRRSLEELEIGRAHV